MSNRKVTVEHFGVEYTGELATIKSTMLGYEDHGVFSAYLECEWAGAGVSVGGYFLDTVTDVGRVGTAFGLDQIIQILRTVGVGKWEALKGHPLIVLFADGRAVGIAGTTNDKVLIFQEHADKWHDSGAVL